VIYAGEENDGGNYVCTYHFSGNGMRIDEVKRLLRRKELDVLDEHNIVI